MVPTNSCFIMFICVVKYVGHIRHIARAKKYFFCKNTVLFNKFKNFGRAMNRPPYMRFRALHDTVYYPKVFSSGGKTYMI